MSLWHSTLFLSLLFGSKILLAHSTFTTRYQSTDIVNVPLVIQVPYNTIESKTYFLTCPTGTDVEVPGPTIYDENGELVWFGSDVGDCMDLNVQTVNGETVLTVWNGTKNSAGTAIMTTFYPIQQDLSSVGGSSSGWLLASGFQEVSIADGMVLFNWSAVDHMPLNESYETISGDVGTTSDTPWDAYHINSISKDSNGDYLVSSRSLFPTAGSENQNIMKVSKDDGAVIWKLGGMTSNFTLDTESTFYGQHHVRWHEGDTKLSIFDDGIESVENLEKTSRGIYLDVNQEALTASLVYQYLPLESVENWSLSQGSNQVLDNGNVVVGFGSNPWIAEYTLNGTTVFFATFGMDGETGNSPLQNYRAYKVSNWVGNPTTSPDIAVTGSCDDLTVYVSWNGATEVTSYAYFSGPSASNLTGQFNVTRSGFETSWNDNSTSPAYVRVAAVAADGTVLGWTNTTAVDA
ncbi:uncharacterized protein STEHIDRAFT_115340 [Stereum hirsutum FP-91666 SS1]|uniref:uncharacterized protein n=1 Tax=Stereum hirsutum (strain FP-91666) TaxID=721885 RepID=UPI000444A610|nr:uncharacterized protein STEHIDRAFT_115340 [Stereum hirsutum FP-91666 SS1]EIM81206.1 hypothetical protein STEHIDRAFT_115340 [Stereum hirsutum FP-91666 SS1]